MYIILNHKGMLIGSIIVVYKCCCLLLVYPIVITWFMDSEDPVSSKWESVDWIYLCAKAATGDSFSCLTCLCIILPTDVIYLIVMTFNLT